MSSARYYRAMLDDLSHNNTAAVAALTSASGLDTPIGATSTEAVAAASKIGVSAADRSALADFLLHRVHCALGTGSPAAVSLVADCPKSCCSEANESSSAMLACCKLCFFNDALAGAVLFVPASRLLQSKLTSLTLSAGAAGTESFWTISNPQVSPQTLTTPAAVAGSASVQTRRPLNATLATSVFTAESMDVARATCEALLALPPHPTVILPIAVLPKYRLARSVAESTIPNNEDEPIEGCIEDMLISHSIAAATTRLKLVSCCADAAPSGDKGARMLTPEALDHDVYYIHSAQGRTPAQDASVVSLLKERHKFSEVEKKIVGRESETSKQIGAALKFLFTYDRISQESREARERGRVFSPALGDLRDEVASTGDGSLPQLERIPAGDCEPLVNAVLDELAEGKLRAFKRTI